MINLNNIDEVNQIRKYEKYTTTQLHQKSIDKYLIKSYLIKIIDECPDDSLKTLLNNYLTIINRDLLYINKTINLRVNE